MIFRTDIISSTTFVRVPEIARIVCMLAPIEVALGIISACVLARDVVGIHLFTDSIDGFTSAPVCRTSQGVEDCVHIVWKFTSWVG